MNEERLCKQCNRSFFPEEVTSFKLGVFMDETPDICEDCQIDLGMTDEEDITDGNFVEEEEEII